MNRAMLVRTREAAPAAKAAPASKNAYGSLRIGDANDFFEQEADRAADRVMAGGPLWSLARVNLGAAVQRKCSCGGSSEGECEECKKNATLQSKAAGYPNIGP